MTLQCCYCKRINNGTGWQFEDDTDRSEAYSHGLCPLCFRKAMLELESRPLAPAAK